MTQVERKDFEPLAVGQIIAMAMDWAAKWCEANHLPESQHKEIASTLLSGALSEMAYGPAVPAIVTVKRAEPSKTYYWK